MREARERADDIESVLNEALAPNNGNKTNSDKMYAAFRVCGRSRILAEDLRRALDALERVEDYANTLDGIPMLMQIASGLRAALSGRPAQ